MSIPARLESDTGEDIKTANKPDPQLERRAVPFQALVRALAWTRTVSRVRPLTVGPAVACRIDADSGQILGCAVFGTEGGEIMTMIRSR